MTGIGKCRMLKRLRNEFCRINGLPLEYEVDCANPPSNCTGTCPACEARLQEINAMVSEKMRRGQEIHYDGLKDIILMFEEDEINSETHENSGRRSNWIIDSEPLHGQIDNGTIPNNQKN